ncbi:enoyl-ACP reductase FabI [Chitinivorax sp. B]|uniref:enoyl-ACP reductase FabI n=1 Tax=Chitinivorax sp. B TaxID=2502235 RepID=UPI0010F82874|nr:enoyl-ACP reductase FabI [Chitinivorax sp. B]
MNIPCLTLAGSKALVVGVANEHSIAWGCARVFHKLGAEVALTYLNEKALPHVKPLAEHINAPLLLPLDVSIPGQLEAVFNEVRQYWGRLDMVVHSIAWAPLADLHGRLTDSSVDGFLRAMDVSCHSFIRMAKLAEPLMPDGGTLLAMSYLGANKVVQNYQLMGPVKAALEASVRYLAYELGPMGIRVHALSPGPIRTRAASGLQDFDELLYDAMQRSPEQDLVDIDDVGHAAAYLCTPAARLITGSVQYIDAGHHIMA